MIIIKNSSFVNKICLALLIGCLFFLLMSSSLADRAAITQSELADIRKQIKSIQKDIANDEKTLKGERSNLQKLEQQISHIKAEQATIKVQVKQTQAEQAQLKAQIDKERLRIDDGLKHLNDLVMRQHATGQNSYLKLLLSQHKPAQAERTMVYYKYLAKLTSKRISDGREQVVDLIELESKSVQQKNTLDQLLTKQKEKQKSIKQSQKKRQNMIAMLDNKLTKSANKVNRLKEDEQRIKKLVNALQVAAKKREQYRIRSAKNRTNAKATSVQNKHTKTHIKPVLERISNDGLGNYQGKLKLPVNGAIKAKYGSIKAGSGVKWNGIMLGVESGQPVRAIYDGQVVYADWFKGFGQLIIIDHGQGYMSLYSHNSQLNSTLGSKVKSNDVIAATGSTGGLAQPGLYFEVRYNGEPRDPLIWCKR